MADTDRTKRLTKEHINRLTKMCREDELANGWGVDEKTGEVLPVDVPLKLCLIHSEISEAMEGDRKDTMDDKLPHRKTIECELADAAIRIFALSESLGLDLGGAIAEKMEYNKMRPDHKPQNRTGVPGAKKY